MKDLRRTVQGVELHKRGFGYAAWIDTLPLAFVCANSSSRRYRMWFCYFRGSETRTTYANSYRTKMICFHRTLKGCVVNAKKIIGNEL